MSVIRVQSGSRLLRAVFSHVASLVTVFDFGGDPAADFVRMRMEPLLDDRFRTNLSFAPGRLACESRMFSDRSRKLGWQAVFQLRPEAATRLRFPSV